MNKSVTLLTLSLLLLTEISCGSTSVQNCEIKEIKTLFTTMGIHERDTIYGHYTLIKNFSRNCLDSAIMVNGVLKYSDTVTSGKPVGVLMIFNSDKDFIPKETSQVMAEINKSCLVVIWFDEKTRKPNHFIFYN